MIDNNLQPVSSTSFELYYIELLFKTGIIGILIFLILNLANKYLLTDLFYFKNILIIIFTFGVFAYLSRFGIDEY